MTGKYTKATRYLYKALIAACAACGVIFLASALVARAQTHTHVVAYRLVLDEGEPGPEVVAQTAAAMRERMSKLARDHGVRKWQVEPTPEQTIQVRLRTRFDPKGLLFWVSTPGRVQFHLAHPDSDILNKTSEEDLPKGYELKVYHEVRYSLSRAGDTTVREYPYVIRQEPVMRVSRFASVEFSTEGMHKQTVLTFWFTESEGEEFRDVTALNIGRHLAMFVDGELFFPPKQIESTVEGGVVQMRGYFYNPPLRQLVKVLGMGPLPARVGRLEQVSHDVEQ